MLDKVAPVQPVARGLSIGSKTLALDPVWSEPPIAQIEFALTRNAAYPEVGAASGLDQDFVFVDPSNAPHEPAHADLDARLRNCADRLALRTLTIANTATDPTGFDCTARDLAVLGNGARRAAFGRLRERIGWLVSSVRFSRRRHLVFPAADGAVYAAVVDMLARLQPAERPFVHLINLWDEADLPNRDLGAPGAVGPAIGALNAERTSTFVYAWSRPLAQRMARAFSIPVSPLDVPPALELAAMGEPKGERLTVGYFSPPDVRAGFDVLGRVIRAAIFAGGAGRSVRFLVQMPEKLPAGEEDAVRAARAEIATAAGRNLTLVEEAMPRQRILSAQCEVDALLLPEAPGGPPRYDAALQNAMAGGKLVFGLEGSPLAGVIASRAARARDPEALGRLIAETAADVRAVRSAARVAKSTYWGTLRPARLFAQLLYGPLVLDGAGTF